jgi:hypothetical protein
LQADEPPDPPDPAEPPDPPAAVPPEAAAVLALPEGDVPPVAAALLAPLVDGDDVVEELAALELELEALHPAAMTAVAASAIPARDARLMRADTVI